MPWRTRGDAAERYAGLHVARVLLRTGIDRFRKEQQEPVLRAAGRHFALLTGGRCERLIVDYDTAGLTVLLAIRDISTECPVEALGEGARDQLYLALRIAAVEAYAAQAEPLPFIADDLLAHFDDIRVQRDIDRLHAAGDLPEPASAAFIASLYWAFYEDAPEAMLLVGEGEHRVRMIPGAFRSSSEHEAMVGRHWPPAGKCVAVFMEYFEQRYRLAPLGMGQKIVAMAAAHRRLNYIHPFLDGNGRVTRLSRVTRLMSHAMALEAGIGANGLWPASRGLARDLTSRGGRKRMMDRAHMPRQGDLDGRGNLCAARGMNLSSGS